MFYLLLCSPLRSVLGDFRLYLPFSLASSRIVECQFQASFVCWLWVLADAVSRDDRVVCRVSAVPIVTVVCAFFYRHHLSINCCTSGPKPSFAVFSQFLFPSGKKEPANTVGCLFQFTLDVPFVCSFVEPLRKMSTWVSVRI